jgi:hypothetical protein
MNNLLSPSSLITIVGAPVNIESEISKDRMTAVLSFASLQIIRSPTPHNLVGVGMDEDISASYGWPKLGASASTPPASIALAATTDNRVVEIAAGPKVVMKHTRWIRQRPVPLDMVDKELSIEPRKRKRNR